MSGKGIEGDSEIVEVGKHIIEQLSRADGPLTIDAIREPLGMGRAGVRPALELLVEQGVVEKQPYGKFALANREKSEGTVNAFYLSAPYRRAYVTRVSGFTRRSAIQVSSPAQPAIHEPCPGPSDTGTVDPRGIMINIERAAQQIAREMMRITEQNTERRIKAEQQAAAAINRAQTAENALNTALEMLHNAGFDGPLTTMIGELINRAETAGAVISRKDVELSRAIANTRRQAERIELRADHDQP